jgi:hypothetical protein
VPAVLLGTVAAIGVWIALMLTRSSNPSDEAASPQPPVRYSAHGASFELPGNWRHLGPAEVEKRLEGTGPPPGYVGLESAEWREVFVLDAHNLVQVIGEHGPFIVNRTNVGLMGRGVLAAAQDAPRVRIVRPPAATTVAGLPALEMTSELTSPDGTLAQNHSIVVFDADADVAVFCQSTEERRDEVDVACAGLRSTLRMGAAGDPTERWRRASSPRRDLAVKVPKRWKMSESPKPFEIAGELVTPPPSQRLARFAVAHDRLPRPMSVGQYVTFVNHEPGNHGKALSRRTLRMPLGPMVREEVAAGPSDLVLYLTARSRNGYAVIFAVPHGAERLLLPTMDAIAGTLTVST